MNSGFPIKVTMDIAQKLYGKITYMMTDSTYIADELKMLKEYVSDKFGSKYYRNQKQKKVKKAQEAHGRIRPTDLSQPYLIHIKNKISPYALILKRTVTSHMKACRYDVCKIHLTK